MKLASETSPTTMNRLMDNAISGLLGTTVISAGYADTMTVDEIDAELAKGSA